ncbi:MAG: hypothetical protein HY801_01100 [Candidatus Lindowbacteria bacterium]|nr:hypothetical protein [Candidatus Lindowbacteria bacterium]
MNADGNPLLSPFAKGVKGNLPEGLIRFEFVSFVIQLFFFLLQSKIQNLKSKIGMSASIRAQLSQKSMRLFAQAVHQTMSFTFGHEQACFYHSFQVPLQRPAATWW